MSGSMSQADLVESLRDSIRDTAAAFERDGDGPYQRALEHAAEDYSLYRANRGTRSVSLEAGTGQYPLGADVIDIVLHFWGDSARAKYKPWQAEYPNCLPSMRVIGGAGEKILLLAPAPTTEQIGSWGSSFEFIAKIPHVIGADAENTTIVSADRGLLLLRAQAELMKEIGLRNSSKPVSMRDGLGVTRNSTPAALYKQLMDEYRYLVGMR